MVEEPKPDFDDLLHYAEIVHVTRGFYKGCTGEVEYHPEPHVYTVFLHYCPNQKPVSVEREFHDSELGMGR